MFCSNCGSQKNANAKFCANCGAAQAVSLEPVNHYYPLAPPQKEVKIWKSVVAIILILTVLIGGAVFGVLFAFSIGPFGSISTTMTNEEAMQAIEELAWEMDRNGGSVPVERAFEAFGDIYEENQWGKLFTLTSDIDVQAHIRNEEVYIIHTLGGHLFITDDNKNLDIDILQRYEDDFDGLTRQYLEDMIGKPGTIVGYSVGYFTCVWRTSEISLSVELNRQGEVEFFFVTRNLEALTPDELDVLIADLLPIDDEWVYDLIDKVALLAFEMDNNRGFTTIERVEELFADMPYRSRLESESSLSIMFCFGLWFSAYKSGDIAVNDIYFELCDIMFPDIVIDRNLVIDIDRMERYSRGWFDIPEDEKPNLSYFENLFGGSGLIVGYSQWWDGRGVFLYRWVSPNASVTVYACADGNVEIVGVRNF